MVQAANLFNEYLDMGGFPEVIKTGYRPMLQEYFQNIIFRDIIARFKIKHGFSLIELAQCCYEIERPETRERELNSLIKALTFYKMREGSIYTFDFENEEQVEGMLIKYIPAWKLSL